ncbi:MAG TPA: hypothetical protein VLX11_12410 [Candidatus Acidoferrales bacterium]|nr:hypothetical protein [Candidatus Acidoferrales bacterium]
MTAGKSVLIMGFEPTLLDYTNIPHLDAAKVMAALKADEAQLRDLGYEVELCLFDLGETAETVVRDRLKQKHFDCILIGAGVRTIPEYFILFEKLINVVHEHAPQSKLCFNTKPSDTAEAVQRWI